MLIKFVAEDKARHCLFFLAKMTHPIKKSYRHRYTNTAFVCPL